MEFDEMKKIWDSQNSQFLYVFDEKGVYKLIQAKMKTLIHVTGISEWMLILINLGAGATLIKRNPIKHGVNIFLWIEAAWLFGIAVYLVMHHIRRIKAGRQFDRSIHGDLDHAISIAGYQTRLCQIIRWNILPTGAILILSGWESGHLLKVSVIILVSYSLAFYVTTKGLQANKIRKRKLQTLKEKLENSSI